MTIAYYEKGMVDEGGNLHLQRGDKGYSIAFCPHLELQHPCMTACALFGEPYKTIDHSSGVHEPIKFPTYLDICNGRTIAMKVFEDKRK